MTDYTVLEASAGSGKTYQLTARIADALTRDEDPLRPAEVIATTFTIKAADELAGRLRTRLLDDGRPDLAPGVAVSLIGTVNSVAGRIVTDYAIDAGLSPDLTVLADDEQKRAFGRAVDEVAAETEDASRDLLRRTEQDAEPDAEQRWGGGDSWIGAVRDVAEKARLNGITAEDLAAMGKQSWTEYADCLPDRAGTDQRGSWLHRFDQGIDSLRRALRDGEVPKRSVGNAEGSLERLEAFRTRDLAAADSATWGAWKQLATLSPSSTLPGKSPGTYPKTEVFAPLMEDVAAGVLASPAYQDDVRALIDLVFTTAARSLSAYRDWKSALGLLDFVDQEVIAVDLVRHDERVRSSLASRFRLLAVDEFQDTSPIQLDLFLALGELVDEVLWVGDVKQAIYAFRGSAPELVTAATSAVLDGSAPVRLSESWRSTGPVLDLTNAVFGAYFAGRDDIAVRLDVAAPRLQEEPDLATRGGNQAWTVRYEDWTDGAPAKARRSNQRLGRAVAGAVEELCLERGLAHGDVAVLVRTTAQRDTIAAGLEERGIDASGGGRDVLDTREGRLVRNALSVCLDRRDTVALVELVDTVPEHGAHTTWFDDLTRVVSAAEAPPGTPDDETLPATSRARRNERSALLESWWLDPALERLRAVADACVDWTPTETLAAIIAAFDLPDRAEAWTRPDRRRRTFDALLGLAETYADRARSTGTAITLPGFLAHLDGGNEAGDVPESPTAVTVRTMHSAKGLQFPAVVTLLATDADKVRPTGSHVRPRPGGIDPAAPLAGRTVLWWPGLLATWAELGDRLDASDLVAEKRAAELANEANLYYVALTRARELNVVVADQGGDHALTTLGRGDLLTWDDGDALHVPGRPPLPARTRRISSALDLEDLPERRARHGAVDAAPAEPAAHPPRRFQASAVPSGVREAEVTLVARLGDPLVAGGGADWNLVGEAVHSYLALPHQALDDDRRRAVADRLIGRWGVGRHLTPDMIQAAGRRWSDWLTATHPEARALTEQPITWHNELGQVMEGWIDELLVLPDGRHILVDHKTYPGDDPVEHVRREHLGQLSVYARALAEATGREVASVYVHLPLAGAVVEVELFNR